MLRLCLLLFCLLACATSAQAAGLLRIATASDLKFAMDEIAAAYQASNPGSRIEVISGSSGKFYQQIVNGAPYDLYFSADSDYPRKLQQAGLAASAVKPYAYGRLVLWSATLPLDKGLAELTDARFRQVAIANPRHAPYGQRAEASLAYYGLLEPLRPKLVLGENVSQAMQFAQSGAADAAIVSLSLLSAPGVKGRGNHFLLDERSYPPLEQAYVVLKHAAVNADAAKFSDYVDSDEARAIFRKYGFRLPGEAP